MRNLKILTMFLIVVVFYSCKKKDIEIPNSNCEKVIGDWEYVSSSGGFSGTGAAPKWKHVNFDKNGQSVWNGDGYNKTVKFKFIRGTSIFSGGETDLIEYGSDFQKQSFKFGVTGVSYDSLFLNEECYDCFSWVLVRK